MWMWGPWIPQKWSNSYEDGDYGITGVSGIAINRTIGIIVFPNRNDSYCLAFMIYDFKAFNWTDENFCFYKLSKELDIMAGLVSIKSVSNFDKKGVMYVL